LCDIIDLIKDNSTLHGVQAGCSMCLGRYPAAADAAGSRLILPMLSAVGYLMDEPVHGQRCRYITFTSPWLSVFTMPKQLVWCNCGAVGGTIVVHSPHVACVCWLTLKICILRHCCPALCVGPV